ncbi:MAG: hypothetical protein ACYTEZ_19155 [Planctomycetota bacterium]|jgi:hypothetical protein
MRLRLKILLGAALAVAGFVVWLAPAAAQEAKSTTRPPPDTIDVRLIWNFYFDGEKKRGEFVELERLDAKQHAGRSLVITRLETRTAQGVRLQVVEWRKKENMGGGKPAWDKTVRRGDPFSADFLTQSTEFAGSRYVSETGMRFDPGTRPTIEVTRGSGRILVHAEGYWSRP